MRTNIFLAGVGGQGILSFARVLGELALIRKMSVLIGETHGMAQRGGSVTATVRFGDAYSPMISRGTADVLVGFEPLEAARYSDILSPSGMAVVSTAEIIPYSVSAMRIKYPPVDDLLELVRRRSAKVIAIDANEIARKTNFILAANSAMLGAVAATRKIDAEVDDFHKAIRRSVPRKVRENIAAFDLGYQHAKRIIDPAETR